MTFWNVFWMYNGHVEVHGAALGLWSTSTDTFYPQALNLYKLTENLSASTRVFYVKVKYNFTNREIERLLLHYQGITISF